MTGPPRPDDGNRVPFVQEIRLGPAGCRSSSWRRVTVMPSRMWPVNQPSLLTGYQFCSRPGYVVTPPTVAAGTAMRAAISRSNQDPVGVHCPFRAYLVYPRCTSSSSWPR